MEREERERGGGSRGEWGRGVRDRQRKPDRCAGRQSGSADIARHVSRVTGADRQVSRETGADRQVSKETGRQGEYNKSPGGGGGGGKGATGLSQR